jgi:hypothetical protein
MSNIIVGFSRPKGLFEPFSWLIRVVEWTPYSHTYIRFYSQTYDRWLVYQASGLKVNFIGWSKFESVEHIYAEFTIPISDQAMIGTVENAIDICGAPYGVGQIIGFGWVLLVRAFGKTVKNPFYSGSSFFCSELVSDVLADIKSVSDTMDPSAAGPREVYNFLMTKGYKSTIGDIAAGSPTDSQ